MAQTTLTQSILEDRRDELLEQWLAAQLQAPTRRADLIGEGELRRQSARFLDMLALAVADGDLATLSGAAWDDLRDLLGNLSAEHAALGFVPSETATFIFSLKEPLFEHMSREQGADPKALLGETWQISALLDKLGLFTVEAFLASRDALIRRQQQEMLELSTPVVRLWQGVLALPLIGTLDSARTQVVMESLLGAIAETDSTIAIIDITGVPTVDTLVAQHLLRTAAAARLMGAEVIISGIRPQIAQTVVQLGVDISEVTTKASLADAFALALRHSGMSIAPAAGA